MFFFMPACLYSISIYLHSIHVLLYSTPVCLYAIAVYAYAPCLCYSPHSLTVAYMSIIDNPHVYIVVYIPIIQPKCLWSSLFAYNPDYMPRLKLL